MEINNIGRKWIVKEPGNPAAVRRLSHELGTDPVLANLLVQRGITTYEEARTFFRPDLKMLHDPFLMKDMEKAVPFQPQKRCIFLSLEKKVNVKVASNSLRPHGP